MFSVFGRLVQWLASQGRSWSGSDQSGGGRSATFRGATPTWLLLSERWAMHRWAASSLAALSLVACWWAVLAADSIPEPEMRKRAAGLQKDGNFREALEDFRRLVLAADSDPDQVGNDLEQAINCLASLGETQQMDALIESAVATHPHNWRLINAAAQQYQRIDHWGFEIAGKFERGGHRGGGEQRQSFARDRVRALQLAYRALELAPPPLDPLPAADGGAKPAQEEPPANPADATVGKRATAPLRHDLAMIHRFIAKLFQQGSGYGQNADWQLHTLTDLTVLPGYEVSARFWGGGTVQAAPVDDQNEPVFLKLPATLAAATNDGERWRWHLNRVAELHSGSASEGQYEFAEYLSRQFGTSTLAGWSFQHSDSEDLNDAEARYALHTLADNETIARLATGIRRFTLPDEFNPLLIYRQLAENKQDGIWGSASADKIAIFYQDRRQFPQAAAAWKLASERFGEQPHRLQSLQQIVKNWGTFDAATSQPAGTGAEVRFRFRNATQVKFTARTVLVDKLLSDVKQYLKSNPRELSWQQLNVQEIGQRLIWENQEQYLGDTVANWSLDLEPRPQHFDRTIVVTTPLQKAGAYLLTAEVPDGNTSRIVLWVADLAIVKKPSKNGSLYFVADAVTGELLPNVNLEFFGWKHEQVQPNTNQYRVVTKNLAVKTGTEGPPTATPGQFIADEKRLPSDYQWLTIATTRGRMAYLGFNHIWYPSYENQTFDQLRVYTITDRPVYRPGQKVNYKLWIRQAKYDLQDAGGFANRDFTLLITSPMGETLVEKLVRTDAYGGVAGELDLAADAKLGSYGIQFKDHGGSSFRVEEYKKPEFEVLVDGPKTPVQLGEKITAKITARYYFGGPVSQGRVKYKIERTSYNVAWFPPGPWDWLYGRGAWWFASDSAWYPGFARWGCFRPSPWWWPQVTSPPELIADREVAIGPDGTVDVEIDTALAKALQGNTDHRYSLTVEVTDDSRRTIFGTGQVLLAREPFQVTTWLERGHYIVGDNIIAHSAAYALDQQPITGTGKWTLYRVQFDADKEPVETEVQTWDGPVDDAGRAKIKIAATVAGQYRLAFDVTDTAGRVRQGGILFTVLGPGNDGRDFQFNSLELIPDRQTYAPGDSVTLQVNTSHLGGTVLLFVRPSQGVYLPPQLVKLKGKSDRVMIPVELRDHPNFFVEAVTIVDGRIHTEVREILVPPAKRVINMELTADQQEYQPGSPAEFRVKLTDQAGKPFSGSTVLTVYDKSLDYIAGGDHTPDIREFFWKWRRSHSSQQENSLERWSQNLLKPNELGMQTIGLFGQEQTLEEAELFGMATKSEKRFGRSERGFRKLSSMRGAMADAMPAPASAPLSMLADGVMLGSDAMAADYAVEGMGGGLGGGGEVGGGPLVTPTIRSKFADTAFWAANVVTDPDGTAVVRFSMPENLTGWNVKTWAMGPATEVGSAAITVTTRKNLLVRLQAPRFFTETDEVVLSANVHNDLAVAKSVQVSLALAGDCLEPMTPLQQTVQIESHQQARVDWRVKVTREGTATIRMLALTDIESDAMEQSFPVYVHGILKTESLSGVLRSSEPSDTATFTVPADRRIADSRFELRFSPTIAGAMVDALPYLAEFPYGCTEQTLNRFLPSVITQKILQQMGLDLAAIREKPTNLNPQELGDPQSRAAQWKRWSSNPVFDPAEVDRMVTAGIDRLTDMQLSDGGWGWFSGWGEHASAHTTAVVLHGLQVAVANDVAVVPDVLTRGRNWLERYQDAEIQKLKNAPSKTHPYKLSADATDALVYQVLVEGGVTNGTMQEYLYRDRLNLPASALALFGVALQAQGAAEPLAMVLRNLSQFLVEDKENQTAYLKLPGDSWWFWWGSDIEANAHFLKLLTRYDPQDPRAAGLVKYLLNNRKHASYWNSTRDTALVIESLAEFWKASGEDRPDMTVEVWLDGKQVSSTHITPERLFSFENAVVLTGEQLTAGPHKLEIRRAGKGPVYWNAAITNFTLEDFITKAGLDLRVQRKIYKLLETDKQVNAAGSRGQVLSQVTREYRREELANLGEVTSGDLIEVELEIEAKNDFEYLLFEDRKAAGCEPVEVRSGYNGNALGAYVEFRDERVAFFVRALARGRHSVSYRLKAEIPGRFSALPTSASAMYAPELRGNSDEIKLQIVDRP